MKSLAELLGGDNEAPVAGKGKMSDAEIAAKMEVIQSLMSEMLESMGHGVKGHLAGAAKPLQEVTVAAESPELLEEGLDKAKDIVPHMDEMSDEAESGAEKSAELKDPALEVKEEEPNDLYSMMQRKKKMGKA